MRRTTRRNSDADLRSFEKAVREDSSDTVAKESLLSAAVRANIKIDPRLMLTPVNEDPESDEMILTDEAANVIIDRFGLKSIQIDPATVEHERSDLSLALNAVINAFEYEPAVRDPWMLEGITRWRPNLLVAVRVFNQLSPKRALDYIVNVTDSDEYRTNAIEQAFQCILDEGFSDEMLSNEGWGDGAARFDEVYGMLASVESSLTEEFIGEDPLNSEEMEDLATSHGAILDWNNSGHYYLTLFDTDMDLMEAWGIRVNDFEPEPDEEDEEANEDEEADE